MPIERRLDPAGNFVFTALLGKIIEAEVRAHMVAMERETVAMPGYREFTDCRGVTDITELSVQFVVDAGGFVEGRGSQVALLLRSEPVFYGMARAFQALSDRTGEVIEIFNDEAKALTWLAQDADDLSRMTAFVEACRADLSAWSPPNETVI